MESTTTQKELTEQTIRKIAALRIQAQGLNCTVSEYIQRTQERTEKAVRIIPARIVLDVDEETGQEFAYEYKARTGEWLNLTTEKYHSDDFIKRMELDILYVEFAGLRTTMDGPAWRAAGSPRYLRGESS